MKKLWGARFQKKSAQLADEFSFSISYDQRLALYDVMAGIAHADMLGNCGIIPKADARKIVSGLKKIGKNIEAGKLKFNPQVEDVHTLIQMELKKVVGAPADKLHTARSRNDLIVTDMKLYCMTELIEILNLTAKLQKSIVKFAAKNKEVIIPAYTHLQSAQLVLLAHHMLAYAEMLERDKGRVFDAFTRTDSCPLGSCALSGTSLPINRKAAAEELGFSAIADNSIDAVSDRDFIAESLSSLAIMGMHFSRIAEDMILWATSEFNFVEIDDSLCTGSSIMPHKKNPDILELIRGETAGLYANLQQILVLTKGMPLTYNRDFQLDKPPLFSSVEKSKMILKLLGLLFDGLKIKKGVIASRINNESFLTVDIMEYLIAKGVSYRDAHDTVGKMVKNCLDKGKALSALTLKELKAYHPKFDINVKKLFNAKNSITIKKSDGSTSPASVAKQLKKWQKLLHI